MQRSKSSFLYVATLGLALALVFWWTAFQVRASDNLADAGRQLIAGDVVAAARSLGAADAADLERVARAQRTMFASEGVFFGAILLAAGWLFLASVRRETAARNTQARFLAAATHELQTPLATIVLLLESLRDGRLPAEKRQRYLENGLAEAERLGRGLGNVLMAAGLRTTRRAARKVEGDLVADVREAVAAIAPRAHAADVTIEHDLPTDLRLSRDPAAMQLVLRNLLDNAVKFSPANSTVRIAVAAELGHANIRVLDRGRGMDADELAHAFEPFWRGNDSASGGTGLGLHLVRELVREHDGAVTANSEGRGRGCEVVVRLPVARPE